MYSLLYVDDEPDLLELAKLFLEQSPDFHVDTRTSAHEALASLQTGSYDAIIADYQMPEMDGIAFLKAVRATFGNIPFILFTGRGREEVVIDAINNGVDFYLQKGGDVKAQFAELSHKVRQSVARWRAESSLIESEKRLADIIDFLPDATLAIDNAGRVIAWNKAIEEMTGLPASSMIGKGDHEYALPLYGKRRPILIDLVLLPDEELTRRNYSIVKKEGSVLVAETTLPHPKGEPKTLSGTASVLFNREGKVAGAIESIRDITLRKKSEDELRAAIEQMTASEEELREQYDELANSERKVRENEARLLTMVGLYEKAREPEQDLLNYAVEGIGAVTGSPLGYLAFLNEDERELSMYAWSKSAMTQWSLRNIPVIHKTDEAGFWGEAVRQRRAVITNDYTASPPAKKGYPEGHPAIVRHMNVPVIDNGHIVLVAGVANKSGDYNDEDVRQLSLLMQSLWMVIKQRRTEDALRESERKYRDLFENSILGIFRTTPEGKFSTLNNAFAHIAGYDTAEEMLTGIQDIRTQLYVNNEDRDRFLNALVKDGRVREFEAQFYHKDGHPVWISINASAIRDDTGSIRYYEGTIEDITEQKNAKQALEKEKIFTDAVINSIPGLLYLYDSEGHLVRWGKSHEKITGYSHEELAGMHILDWYKGDEKSIAAISAGVKRALAEGFASGEADLLIKSGKRIPFFFTAQRLQIEGKTYFTGIGIDITERRKAQDELQAAYEQITASEEELREQVNALTRTEQQVKESEENYRSLVELSPVAVIVHRFGKIIYANPETLRLAGAASPDEVLGRDVLDFIHPDYHALAAEHFRILSKEGTTIPLQEEVLLTLDKKPFTVEITAKPVIYQSMPSILVVFRDISYRKKTEMELRAAYEQLTASNEELQGQYEELAKGEKRIRASEEQLRNVIDFSPIGMHFYALHDDDTLVFTGANPAADAILGVDHHQFVGKTIEDAFPILTGTEIPAQYRQVARTGEVWHTDQVTYEGETIRGAFAVTAFRVRPGNMAAMFSDITERKRTEQALLEKTEELDRYFTTSLDLFCIADTEGHFRRLNPEWEKTLGYTLPELEGHRFLDFVHPEDLPATLAAVSELDDQKEVLNFTNRYRHRDGSYRWIEWRSRPVGNLIYAAARDITPRREMEASLRQSEEKYRTVLENIPDGFIRTDALGNLILASPSAARMFGYDTADNLVGMPLQRFYYRPKDRQQLLEMLAQHGQVADYETDFVKKDGSVFKGSLNAHLLRDDKGDVIGTDAILYDVTERHRMEIAIREANRKLSLLNTITRHDVANQLVALQGFVQIAAMRKIDPVTADYLEKIGSVADTITRQIEFARTYQELGIKMPAWYLIEQIISSSECPVPVQFSGTCRGVEIFADPMLERVFFNMFDNAVRHGGKVTQITVRCEREPDGIVVIVEDDGIGVEASEKEKIFSRGYGKHTGMGLFLVREILAITNITIRETGISGHGARFEMLIPKESYRFVKSR
jgi:PAS domain S-box-containing protein